MPNTDTDGDGVIDLHDNCDLNFNPNQLDTSLWLATALDNSGDIARNLAVLEELTERDPLFRPAFSNTVFMFDAHGRRDEAFERAFADASRGRIRDLFGLYNRADRSDELVAYFEERWPSLDALAGDYEKALGLLEAAAQKGVFAILLLGEWVPEFATIKSEPRFAAIENTMLELVNGQRAELGLDPVNPLEDFWQFD